MVTQMVSTAYVPVHSTQENVLVRHVYQYNTTPLADTLHYQHEIYSKFLQY